MADWLPMGLKKNTGMTTISWPKKLDHYNPLLRMELSDFFIAHQLSFSSTAINL
jgi:hypothetical protein